MKQFYALWAIGALMLTACNNKEQRALPSDVHYFCGEFVQQADSAVFYDCATGVRYPVSRQDAYPETVRKYLALKPTPGQRVFLELNGALSPRPRQTTAPSSDSLVIESLIGFDPEGSCQSAQLLVGLYEAQGPDSLKTVLQLKPNYTFVLTRHTSDSTQVSQEGTWGLTSATGIELNRQDEQGIESHTRLRIDPQQAILWHGEGSRSRSFKKIYI